MCTACPLTLSAPVAAQEATADPKAVMEASSTGVDMIVVTAQKREENLQQVPLAISAFAGDTLVGRGVDDITELGSVTPGLYVGAQNGTVQPFLRGIGNSGSAIGNESSVAIYIDGVYYTTLPSGAFSLGNVSRVEVLKGPQGTLFGRNASGGVIHVVTRDPSFTSEILGKVSFDNYSTLSGDIYATTGLSENLAVDISFSGQKQWTGYGRNRVTGNRNGYADFYTARSKLLFDPSEATRFTLAGSHSYSKPSIQHGTFPGTTQGTFTPPFEQTTGLGFYDRNEEIDSYTKFEQTAVSLTAEQDLNLAQLKSISSYIYTSTYGLIDPDWTPRRDYIVQLPGKSKQFTQELQLSSAAGSSLTWVAGLYYYYAKQAYTGAEFRGAVFGPGFDAYGQQTADSSAAYGQASYEILPRLTLTGGLRYTHDKTTGTGGITGPGLPLTTPITDTQKTNKVTYKAAIDYQATDDILFYASHSRGYKSLAYNLLPFAASSNRPEVLDSYEIGMKSEFWDRRVRFNVAAFYYDLQDPQVQLLATAAVLLSNADSARVKGVDVDLTAVPVDGLTLRLSGSYLDSKYEVYGIDANNDGICDVRCAPSIPPVDPANPPAGGLPYGNLPGRPILAGGNTIPRSPEVSGTIGFDYEIATSAGMVTLTGDYYYNSGVYFEPDNFLYQPKYGIFNARINFEVTERLSFALWGKNLTDKKFITYSGAQEGPAGYPYTPGAPLTFGVTVGFNY